MTPTGNNGLSLAAESYDKSDGTGAADWVIRQLRATLAKADDRIAILESELAGKQGALNRLLADDLQTCEELAELQKMIWGYHRGLPGDCECDICVEVEQRQRELKSLMAEDAETFQSFRDIL